MTDSFSFENLKVYQKSLDFTKVVYEISTRFPKEERFVLTDQFRRAAISISLNIAEGYGASNSEFKRYLRIAKGSIRECVALITLSNSLKYIDIKQQTGMRERCSELSKMISGLIKSLE